MRKLYLLTFCCFFLLYQLQAQTTPAPQSLNPSLENIFPPSPNAAALGKFGSIPVGQSTGIPQVNVPIYAYENKSTGLKLAVSLDYHAGGVRVDEVASDVGIGWALNAGGVISRTMRGIYDEAAGIGFINSGPLPQSEQAGNDPYDVASRPFNDMYAWELDSQNDLFNFNFNGLSGKFMYGKNDQFLMINQQKLRIEKETGEIRGNSMISGFTVTDEYGFKYIFDAEEVTTNRSMVSVASIYTTSWYLTKILTPTGKDSITLTYDDVIYTYNIGRSASETIPYPGLYSELPERPFSGSISAQSIEGKRLRGISFPDGVMMSFDYNSFEREDLPGTYLLEKITISKGSLERGYKLLQDYSLNRATLKKVIPFGGLAETEEPGYEFTYDMPLPDRLSSKQDHWGFYNDNQGGLIPSEIIAVSGGGDYGQYDELSGGNRDTDPANVKAGSLKRIRYPTGGYTEFEMEANQAVDPRLGAEITYAKEKYSREDAITVECSSSGSYSENFIFQGDPNSQTDFTVRIPSVSSLDCNSTSCKVVLEIKDSSGLVINRLYYDPPIGSYAPEHEFPMTILMPGETYTVTTYTQGLSNYYTYIDFRWRETRIENPVTVHGTIGHKQLYVGGLRAKRISDYNSSSAVSALVKEYDYTLADGTSSGTLGIYPVYSTPVHYATRTDGGFINEGTYERYNETSQSPNFISRSSSTLHPLAYVNGSPVAYKRVVEKTAGNGEYLGRTERYFESFEQVPAMIIKPFPFTPPEYKEWCNGLLDSTLVYDKSDKLVRKEVNGYQFLTDNYWQDPARFESFRSVSIAPVKYLYDPEEGTTGENPDIFIPCWVYPRFFEAEFFYPDAGRAELVSTTTYDYDPNGGVIKAGVVYNYDPTNLYLKSSTSTSSSKNLLIKKLNYPLDMVERGQDPEGVYAEMVAANILNPIVEESQWVDLGQQGRVLQSLVRTNYHRPYPDRAPGVFVPRTMEVQNGSGALETRLRYLRYDERGKAQTVSREGDMPITYVWGFNHSLPVAEVKNASYAQVEAALGGTAKVEELAMSATLSQAQLDQLNGLRAQLPNAVVTTYTYNPLEGVKSMTDPNGRVTSYEYDDFGRLKSVKDNAGNVVQGLEYHYAGQ